MSSKSRVVAIALITAVAVLGDAMLFIVLPLNWEEFGLTAVWQVGVLLSINRFVRLPITPLIGLFYKKFDVRVGMVVAVCLAGISTLFYGLSSGFIVLLIMRIFWGIAWSFIRLGGLLTVVSLSQDTNRGNLMGLYNGLWGLGGLTGMLAGGVFVDIFSITAVTTIFAFGSFLLLPFIYMLIPKTEGKEAAQEAADKYKNLDMTFLTPYIRLVIATSATMGFIVLGIFASSLSTLIGRSYDEQWSILGLTIGVLGLAGAIQAFRWAWEPFIAPLFGRMVDRSTNKQTLILVPLLISIVTFWFLGFLDKVVPLLIVIFVFQFASTMFVTVTDTLAAGAASKTDSVKMMTVHTVMVDLGAAIGPLLSFLILFWFDLSMVFYVASILMAVLAAAWILYGIKQKKTLSRV
ncbi:MULTISPECIES: MFS transporter [Shouchella]|uniref:MFS transporter n=2 Tax=Shouchella TaxID=2893057 RepID=A0ABY7W462_9BACI|nr:MULTISPECIES: MFS transporter [Shouchella]MED4129666.1 MFS transporter [Shouchella miscanthi]WDF02248.1 MFS transporter [Shouchella hunanensis]